MDQAGDAGGFYREFARLFVEGRRDGEDDLLLFEAGFRGCADCAVPGVAQMHEVARGGFDRGDHGLRRLGLRGQDFAAAIDSGVGEPRLGRGYLTGRDERALLAGEQAGDHGRVFVPGGADGSGGQLLGGGKVEEGRQRGERADFSVGHQLRNLEDTNRGLLCIGGRFGLRIDVGSVYVGYDRVGGAQIDADEIARGHRDVTSPFFRGCSVRASSGWRRRGRRTRLPGCRVR